MREPVLGLKTSLLNGGFLLKRIRLAYNRVASQVIVASVPIRPNPSRRARPQGSVLLAVLVGADGRVNEVSFRGSAWGWTKMLFKPCAAGNFYLLKTRRSILLRRGTESKPCSGCSKLSRLKTEPMPKKRAGRFVVVVFAQLLRREAPFRSGTGPLRPTYRLKFSLRAQNWTSSLQLARMNQTWFRSRRILRPTLAI